MVQKSLLQKANSGTQWVVHYRIQLLTVYGLRSCGIPRVSPRTQLLLDEYNEAALKLRRSIEKDYELYRNDVLKLREEGRVKL